MKKSIMLLVVVMYSIVNTYSQEKLIINTSKSEIKWSGEYAFYFGGHEGTINFKEGYFIKTNDVITGGEFIIDMNTIKNSDIKKADANASLVEHLKDPDFFDVKNYALAKLTINNAIYQDNTHMKVHANLTIKGKTLPINFQAEIDYEKEQLNTKFKIDRTLWGINFNSKEVEGKLKDGIISDAIGFEVKLILENDC